MLFRILGPLEVEAVDGVVPLTGPRQRALLALLLLHANEVVSSDRLMEALWPEGPPASGTNALQARISQLRKAFGSSADSLETKASGYLLRVEPESFDLLRFERLVAGVDGSDQGQAAAALREALALWRGPALDEFRYADFAQPAISRLEELRLATLERRIDADLELGRQAELVAELEALISQHPLRERLRRQLMLALYREGRQADALNLYAATRDTLIDELGIEPSPALRELQQSILRQDAELMTQPLSVPKRRLLVGARDPSLLQTISDLSGLLARKPEKELILTRAIADGSELAPATKDLNARRTELIAGGVVARTAAFVSQDPAKDLLRLATEYDVDLVLIDSPPTLDDAWVARLLDAAPCDVAVLVGGRLLAGRPVVVPFAGADHDWAAIELAAWAAGASEASLKVLGADDDLETGRRNASRLLASASIAVQRVLGIPAEPLLVKLRPAELLAATSDAGLVVIGLSERWRTSGLGTIRTALAQHAQAATLLVRRGLRPGGLAPNEQRTRFTWSIKAPG